MPPETLIARQSFKIGGRSYEPGDLYEFVDADDTPSHARSDNMKVIGRIGPLDRRAYALAMQQRPAGTVGRGFTLEYLQQHGIIDAPEPEDDGEPLEQQTEPVVMQEGDVVERGYILRPRHVGKRTFVTVFHPSGALMKEQELPSMARATEFVQPLEDVAGWEPPASTES